MNRKGACEKTSTYLVELPLETIFVVTAMMPTAFIVRYISQSVMVFVDAAVLSAMGFSLFFASKLSLFFQGQWITWGPTSITMLFKVMYFTGYTLMLLGVVVAVAALLNLGNPIGH
ncbi:MAG: hypothetical protein GY847_16475 [Proteobacteria bacterium]|nr:hypothetical protein [Pseudomonadota bacterium]